MVDALRPEAPRQASGGATRYTFDPEQDALALARPFLSNAGCRVIFGGCFKAWHGDGAAAAEGWLLPVRARLLRKRFAGDGRCRSPVEKVDRAHSPFIGPTWRVHSANRAAVRRHLKLNAASSFDEPSKGRDGTSWADVLWRKKIRRVRSRIRGTNPRLWTHRLPHPTGRGDAT